MNIELKAQRIADASPAPVGIDPTIWISLISILIRNIVKCFRPDDAERTARYVSKRFNPTTGKYKHRILERMTAQAKAAASQQGLQIDAMKAEELAIKTLDEARLGDMAENAAIYAEAR